jgi:hypothetical protein
MNKKPLIILLSLHQLYSNFNYRFNLPAFLVVGVDCNGKNRLFAFGLIATETIKDFLWVFRNFKHIMNGKEPKVILTD